MSASKKKMDMAQKMYKQNSSGIGSSPKNYQNGKETKPNTGGQKFSMNGKDTGRAKGEKYSQSNTKGSFNAKYNQADPKGSMKGGYDMANC